MTNMRYDFVFSVAKTQKIHRFACFCSWNHDGLISVGRFFSVMKQITSNNSGTPCVKNCGRQKLVVLFFCCNFPLSTACFRHFYILLTLSLLPHKIQLIIIGRRRCGRASIDLEVVKSFTPIRFTKVSILPKKNA